ncbi:MAG TPA: carboxypeptidase regulatory-like domain-containing protein, partial [Terriglobia bacterium]|nr:carboxypeptidase regulatory-like domain-containing protein [Terriglobia bacterium]
MKRFLVAFGVFASLLLLSSSLSFGQSLNATVGGTVADSSGALVPGVTITATNNATGVVTSVITNEAGAYNIASLLSGVYKISASLPGFQTQTYSDVQLGSAAQVRLNFTLNVANVAQSVEVSIAAQNLITSSSSSVGEVLPQRQIEDLPLVSNNVLDLVGTMAGVFMTNDPVFGAEQTNFAGVSARDINVQRDGISINNQRWPNGLDSPTRMNPD